MDGHAKSDHEVERVQLQEDIERLQDTLQVHSDDEYIYDSDDDYLLIDLDSEHSEDDLNVDEDVSTRSSFDAKSPYTIQGNETPVDDAFTTLQVLLKKGTSDAGLPVCVESGLALNRAYQEVILSSLRNIQEALSQNREKQAALEEEELAGPSKGPSSTRTLKVFSVPFFKDSNGACPPSNTDVYMKQKVMKEPKVDPMALFPWHINQKKKLKQGVKRDCLEKALKPLMTKRESLEIQLHGIDVEKHDQNVVEEIQSIDAEINSIKKLPMSDLVSLVDESQIDWMKISILDLSGNRSYGSCKLIWQNVLHPHINRAPWLKAENAKLMKLMKKHNYKDWKIVAEQLATNRSPFQCLHHYQVNLNKDNRGKSSWTKEEDDHLIDVVEEIKSAGCRLLGEKVATYVDGRSALECMLRWYQIDPSLNRGAWLESEDAMLITAVELMGRADWFKIHLLVPNRSPSQCRERFNNCLDPKIYCGPWEYEEDKRLMLLVEKHGQGKWSNVVKELPGRTDNQALQRYNRLIKWKNLNDWFEALPDATKKAMLGKNLSAEEFHKLESLNWTAFQKKMGVFKEDYEKQRRDRAKGDIVVPRPPCVMSYTKYSATSLKFWNRRLKMQDLISLHVKKIRSQQVYDNKDPKELANMVAKMFSEDLQDRVATHVINAHHSSLTVRSLIGISRKMSTVKKPHYTSCTYMSERLKVNESLCKVLQALSAPITKRSYRPGRPRKYFIGYKPLKKEQERKRGLSTISFYSKALGLNVHQLLKVAALMAKEQRKNSDALFDFEMSNDIDTLTSICYGDDDPTENTNDDGNDDVPCVDVDDEAEDDTKDLNDTLPGAMEVGSCSLENQNSLTIASAVMETEQLSVLIDSDVEEISNSTVETTAVTAADTESGKCVNSATVDSENTSVEKDIGKELPIIEDTQSEMIGTHEENTETSLDESHLESSPSVSKQICAKSLLAVEKGPCKTVVNNKENENSSGGENVRVTTPGSNTKRSSVIILSTGSGKVTTRTASVEKQQENTSSNTEQTNKQVIPLNSANLFPKSFKSSTGFQKPFLPKKSLTFRVNFGVQPRLGIHKKVPTRPASVELNTCNKRANPNSKTVDSNVDSKTVDSNVDSNAKIQCPNWGTITSRTLPPSVSSLRGFQMLLLKNKQMTISALNFRTDSPEKTINTDYSTESMDISRHKQDVDPMHRIRNTDSFQRLQSRFEAIFLWPGLIATTDVPEIVDMSEASPTTVDNSHSVPSASKKYKPKKSKSRKRKRHDTKLKNKAKEKKSKTVDNEDADGEAKRPRLGRPRGSKTCKEHKPELPPRSSQRQTTQEKKIYVEPKLTETIQKLPIRKDPRAPRINLRNQVFKLMQEYVKSKKMKQQQDLFGEMTTGSDCPALGNEVEQEQMDTLSEDQGQRLVDNPEELKGKEASTILSPSVSVSQMIPTVSQITAPVPQITAPVSHTGAPVSHTAAPVCGVTAPVSQITAPVCEVTAPVSEMTAPVCEVTAPVSQANSSVTTSLVNVDASDSPGTDESKTECNIPATNVSTLNEATLPSQTLNTPATSIPENLQNLIPMILSFDKDSEGNIIQTLRPLNDLSQLPPNFSQNHEEIAKILSSDNKSQDSSE